MFFVHRKIQSVFELSDGSGLAVTVARYETPAHTDIDKVHVFYIWPMIIKLNKTCSMTWREWLANVNLGINIL